VARLHRTQSPSLAGTLQEASRGLMWVALPIAVGATMTAGTIVAVVFGSAYAPSAPALAILIWSCVTVSANVPFAVLMLARSQDRLYMGVTVLGAFINVLLNLIVIPRFGMLGAAVTTLISEVTVLAFILWYTRDVSARIIVRAFGWALPPTIIMALVLVPFREHVVAFVLGVLIYVIASLATRALALDDIRRLLGGLGRRSTIPANDGVGR
jgi:O-antigen/teichoic acid export membrane protein